MVERMTVADRVGGVKRISDKSWLYVDLDEDESELWRLERLVEDLGYRGVEICLGRNGRGSKDEWSMEA